MARLLGTTKVVRLKPAGSRGLVLPLAYGLAMPGHSASRAPAAAAVLPHKQPIFVPLFLFSMLRGKFESSLSAAGLHVLRVYSSGFGCKILSYRIFAAVTVHIRPDLELLNAT